MDLWVVAAAVGAGYIGKHLQNLPLSEKESLVESSSKFSTHASIESRNLLLQIRDKTWPSRRLARKRAPRDASSGQKDGLDGRILDMEQLGSSDSHAGSRMTSNTCSSDVNVASNVIKEDYNVLWLSSLPPGFSGSESILENTEFMDADNSTSGLGKFKLLKSRSFGHLVKPLSLLQSGLAPQLYKEHEKMEEYVYSSLPSPCIPTVRPLLLTEGTEIISRSNSIPLGKWSKGREETIKSHACWNGKTTSSRDPSLSNNSLVELPDWKSVSSERVFGRASHLPGSTNMMLLFMVGIYIGIISTILANENEVTNLNEKLKQANNLVQDLEEELEMKEKLTVKDLADESSQPLIPQSQSNEPEVSETACHGTNKTNDKTAEDPLLSSEIEAELEAELERLELNMKTSIFERTSEFVELDPQFEAETIEEDMKIDLLRRQYADDLSETDYDEESGTATDQTLPPNYAVSPRELAIRLHELIESRLEARIKEVETALRNSQNRFEFLESEEVPSQNFLSTPKSPASLHEHNSKNGPLFSNLSVDALGAYRVYGEMSSILEKDQRIKDSVFD